VCPLDAKPEPLSPRPDRPRTTGPEAGRPPEPPSRPWDSAATTGTAPSRAAFDTTKILAHHKKDNPASGRVLEKAGFNFEIEKKEMKTYSKLPKY